MRYYKLISDGYLLSVGSGGAQGEEITETEYNAIREVIRSRPTAPEGYDYRLTESLEWELCELPEEEIVEELTEIELKAQAYDIMTGVTV